MATQADLDQTVKQVEALDRRIVARQADVRDPAALARVLDEGLTELGHLDIVCANAGICTVQAWDEVTPRVWQDTLDTNLTGVWNTMVAAAPHLIANGGGSIIATSSTAGIKGLPFLGPYVAAKHGVVGIARSLANELARHKIRVNTVHPTGVTTPMLEGLGGLDPLHPREVRIAIVLDNFSPHRGTKVDTRVADWAAASNVELAYVPFYGSWLNRIEAQFTALRYFAIDGTDHPSHKEQASMIRRYLIWRNTHHTDPVLRTVVRRAETIKRATVA